MAASDRYNRRKGMNPAHWSPGTVEILTVSEIEQRHSDQWVLVGQPQANASHEVQSGQVLFASHDRDEVYRKAVELRPGRFAMTSVRSARSGSLA
jgi:hypothetical protein